MNPNCKLRNILILPAIMGLSACSGISRNPVPLEYVDVAEIPGIPNARVLGGERSDLMQRELVESLCRSLEYDPLFFSNPKETENLLAISGGGAEGAYSVGILNGWTDSGKRPEFNLVTGVSSGALIAPFAFLGPKYDPIIKGMYTSITSQDIFRTKPLLFSILGSDSLADTAPMAQLIAEHIDEAFLSEIAKAYEQGRLLLIGTTNLDRRRFTIWNMTAIAASKAPGALNLFRKIMLASSSIPVAFPPAYINVLADGQQFDEMHVDGSVVSQATALTSWQGDIIGETSHRGGEPSAISIYVVFNGRIAPESEAVEYGLIKIAGR